MPQTLLAIMELGGYPNLMPLYQRLGYHAEVVNTGRKALSRLKKLQPDVVVAEFNYQHAFRDRTSALESILATVQSHPSTRVLVFYEPESRAHLEAVRSRFPHFEALAFPITEEKVAAALAGE